MDPGAVNLLRNRPLLLLAATVGLTCGLLASAGGFVDLQVYRFGGGAVIDGRLYDHGTPGSGLPFTYPPFAALLLAPFAAVPFPLLVAAWSAASVLVLGWVLARFVDETAYAARPRLVALLTLAALGLEPVWAGLSFGQVNVFLMGLVVADLLAVDRRRAGVLIGVAAGLKLTPLLVLVFLLFVGRRRAAARAGLAFLGTVGIGFALAPGPSAAYWTRLLWDEGRVGGVPYAGNQSMLAGLFRLLGHEPSTLLWFVVAGAAAFGVLLVAAAAWRSGLRPLAVCLAAVATLVASPISWSHHWVWAAPMAVALATSGRLGRNIAWTAAGAWVLVFASTCIWWPPHRNDTELAWTTAEQIAGNAYLLAALLVTAYAAVLATRRPVPDRHRHDEARGPLSRLRRRTRAGQY
jgi:alpha-1,2-mannosyltransferase